MLKMHPFGRMCFYLETYHPVHFSRVLEQPYPVARRKVTDKTYFVPRATENTAESGCSIKI